MITLNLDWREVLWWMQGGMAGSHLRWNVYEDMVNRVWPQCSEQERRNMWLIMRRDLGTYWRPDGWNGHSHMQDKGEGPWLPTEPDMSDIGDTRLIDCEGEYPKRSGRWITDKTPWMYFRQVLARFDPDNQFAVTMRCGSSAMLDGVLARTPAASFVKCPTAGHIRRLDSGRVKSLSVTVRAYRWHDEYRIDWSRRCDPDYVTNIEKLDIPDTG